MTNRIATKAEILALLRAAEAADDETTEDTTALCLLALQGNAGALRIVSADLAIGTVADVCPYGRTHGTAGPCSACTDS